MRQCTHAGYIRGFAAVCLFCVCVSKRERVCWHLRLCVSVCVSVCVYIAGGMLITWVRAARVFSSLLEEARVFELAFSLHYSTV